MFALYPGASGLNAYGEAMTVIGSNIANVNTTGYKTNRVNFQDMLSTAVKGTRNHIGKGVNIISTQGDFGQGSMQATSQITDMALEGDGFFNLTDRFGKTSYTRSGNFKFDKDGFLVAQNGKLVMAREVDQATGQAIGFPKGAKVVGLSDPPKATGDGTNDTGVKIRANLDAEAKVPNVVFDPTNVQAEMFNSQTSVTVIDEKGAEHVLNVVFRKLPDQPPQVDQATGQQIPGTGTRNRWQWYTVLPGGEVGAPPENLIAVGGGFMNFSENGRLLSVTNGSFIEGRPAQVTPDGRLIPPQPPVLVEQPLAANLSSPQVTLPFTDNPQVVGINFGLGSNPLDPADERTGLEGVTQFASQFKVVNVEADGYKAGSLESVDVTDEGVVTGQFDNGNIRSLYRLTVTKFVNNQGLKRKGENEYVESGDSGKPITGHPRDGTFGSLRSRNLEKSNVDMSTEFVRMIETQRAFQANAKGITASDEMLADLVSMKR